MTKVKCLGKWVPGDVKCIRCPKKEECKRITSRGGRSNGKGIRTRREL